MVKSKKSILNAIFSLLLNLLNGFLGFILINLILKNYGSDFNGINATATQIVSMLLLVEGGFTIATNVALFKPCSENNVNVINSIIVATSNQFKRIGKFFLAAGIVIAIVYSFLVTSELNTFDIFLIILMAIIPSSVNLYYATKYRILIQAEQKEYIISMIGILTITISYVVNIFVAYMDFPAMTIRFVTMIFTLIQCFLIARYAKKHYGFIDLLQAPNYTLIKGTKDIFIQKITGVIYNTAPIILISLSNTGMGPMLASVYSVYNNVFLLIRAVLSSIIDGPRLIFGQLITERDNDYVYKRFYQYELVVIILLNCILSTTVVLIIPFMKLFTAGVTDINYIDPIIAALMCATTFFTIIHIPSGNILNMSGNFKISKKIQLIACTILIISMLIGSFMWGVYGILSAVLITAIVLSVLEVGYVHTRYFNNISSFLKSIIINILIFAILVVIEILILPSFSSYIYLVLGAILIFTINCLVIFVVNYFTNRKNISFLIQMVLNLVKNI